MVVCCLTLVVVSSLLSWLRKAANDEDRFGRSIVVVYCSTPFILHEVPTRVGMKKQSVCDWSLEGCIEVCDELT